MLFFIYSVVCGSIIPQCKRLLDLTKILVMTWYNSVPKLFSCPADESPDIPHIFLQCMQKHASLQWNNICLSGGGLHDSWISVISPLMWHSETWWIERINLKQNGLWSAGDTVKYNFVIGLCISQMISDLPRATLGSNSEILDMQRGGMHPISSSISNKWMQPTNYG